MDEDAGKRFPSDRKDKFNPWGAEKDNNWLPERPLGRTMPGKPIHGKTGPEISDTMEEAAAREKGGRNQISCTSTNPNFTPEKRWGANIFTMDPREVFLEGVPMRPTYRKGDAKRSGKTVNQQRIQGHQPPVGSGH